MSKSIENILAENHENLSSSDETAKDIQIDEEWFVGKAIDVIKSKINKQRIFQILCEVKTEQKLCKIFEMTRDDFDVQLLAILIECSFESIIEKFKHDCFQHNPHMNYLKVSPVLRQSMNMLCNKMNGIIAKLDENSENVNIDQAVAQNRNTCEIRETMTALCIFSKYVLQLQQQCMIYVEVSFVNKFLNDHLFQKLDFQRMVQFSLVCLNFIECTQSSDSNQKIDDLTTACQCLAKIMRIQFTFNESNNYFNTDDSHGFFNRLLPCLYDLVREHLAAESFLEKNQLNIILNEQNQTNESETTAQLCYAKAIFLGAYVESNFVTTESMKYGATKDIGHWSPFKDIILSLIITTMRNESFYFFAVTPREIVHSFDWQHKKITFQSVPIDYLNEFDIVEKFLKR